MDRMDRETHGLAVLVDLSWDRFLYAGAILAALGLSAALHSVM
ncbi:hypothetical protein [Aliiroseovarius sp. M344]|nr:hypothetical protein [Aliiroseovarius sp. M344]